MKPDTPVGRAAIRVDQQPARRDRATNAALRRARGARHAAEQQAERAEPGCIIRFTAGQHCDQCGRPTNSPHFRTTRAYCRGCCPACARAALPRGRAF
jgi:hypothetical protein